MPHQKNHLTEYFNDIQLLNKKGEFINACRHQSKLLLGSLKASLQKKKYFC